MSSLGEHIRELRVAAGMSQTQLAASVGVTASAVSQWESGLSKTLKGETLIRVANALAVEPQNLLAQTSQRSTISHDEQQLLALYRALPAGHKDIAVRLLKALK